MKVPVAHRLRGVATVIAVGSPVASHIAIALGRGYGEAVALAGLQAAATGILLWGWLPRRRWAAGLVPLALWIALASGSLHGPAQALLAEAGVAHAMVYSVLAAAFARSLLGGRVALVTWIASRVNAHFHAGQVPYTRAVTWGWVAVFAAELAASAVLLATSPSRWASFVTTWHVTLPIVYAVSEAMVRRWRWRHEHSTGLLATIRGTRRLMR